MQDDLKYVIDEYKNVAVFSPTATHADVARTMHGKPIAAGFIRFGIGTVVEDGERVAYANCFGESISLNIKSRGQEDADLIIGELFN